MQNRIRLLKEKIRTVYRGNPWYGRSVKSILNEINPEIVFTSAGRNVHCIAELLTHMITWREIVFRRMKGDVQSKINQMATFRWERIDTNKKKAWKSLLNALDESQQRILREMDKMNDEDLQKKVRGKKYNLEFLLEGKIQHDIYHLGQIAFLNKLLNS